jgi:hypothetical protein
MKALRRSVEGKRELVGEEVRAGVERALVKESSHTSPGNILKRRGGGNARGKY